MTVAILLLSIIIQLIALALAMYLIRVTDRHTAWLFMTGALLLMVVERGVVLLDPHVKDHHSVAEPVALLVSSLVLIGVILIRPYFRTQQIAAAQSQKTEATYQLLMEHSPSGIFITNPKGQFIDANVRALEMIGYTRPQLLKSHLVDILELQELAERPIQYDAWVDGNLFTTERTLTRADGSTLAAAISGRVLADGRLLGVAHDISEQHQQQHALDRANRALRTRSEINQAMLRATDEAAFLQQICTTLIDTGGYHFAWVGFMDQERRVLQPIAHAGHGSDYLDIIMITWDEDSTAHGPAGQAIRTGQPGIARNIHTDSAFAPWREAALQRGYQSAISLPISGGSGPIGTLNIYATQADAFDSNEVALLSELVADVSFGLRTLRTHQALEESELLYRTLLENAAIGIAFTSTSAHTLYANDRACEISGYPKDELPSVHLDDMYQNPADREALTRRIEKEGRVVNYEVDFKRKDGTPYSARLSITPVPYKGQQAFLSTIEDITAYKQTQEALRQQQQFSEKIIATAHAIILVLDENANITRFNTYAEALTGYAASDILGQNWIDTFILPAEQATIQAVFREVFMGKNMHWGYKNQIACKDGSQRTIRWQNSRLLDDSGYTSAVLAIGIDVTDQALVEQQLQEERTLLRTLIDTLPDYIYAKDMQARFILNNIADTRAMGVSSPHEVLGKTDFDFYPNDMATQFFADDQQVLQHGQSIFNREEPGLDDSGNVRQMLTTKVPLRDAEGHITGLIGIGRDITERKLIEQTLHQERTMLRTLIDTLPDRIYVKDTQSRFMLVNQAVATAHGAASPDAVLGTTDADFFPPEMVAQFWTDEVRLLTSGKPIINREEPQVDGDGNPSWILTTKVPLHDKDGQVVGLIGVGRDITERKRTEEILRERETLFRTIFQTSPDAVAITRLSDDTVIDVNESLLKISGYARDEIVGQPVADLHIWDTPAAHLEMMKAMQIQGFIDNHETRFRLKDGNYRTGLASGRLMVLSNEPHLLWVVRDIEDRVQAEEALRQSEARYRLLFDQANDAIFLETPGEEIIDANLSACRLFGYRHDQLIGMKTSDLQPATLTTPRHPIYQAPFDAPSTLPHETRARRADGTEFDIEITFSAMQLGSLTLILSIVRDITERKQIEATRLERERLHVALQKERELGQLKSRFMTIVSHEFRTPLAVISTAADLLQNYWNRFESLEREREFSKIQGQIAQLTAMLNDISLVNKAQAGHLSFNPVPTDLIQFARLLVQDLQSTIGEHHRIAFNFAGKLVDIPVDQKLLEHALRNLVANAIKYSPRGSAIDVNLHRDHQQVIIRVTDEGIGIPEADVARIFDAYHRAQNVSTASGTGLGLKIVEDCVALHGGDVEVESTEGIGSTFTITLPIRDIE